MDVVSKAQQQIQTNQENRLSRFGKNLHQWPKGKSGNPGGRPKRKFTTKIYAELFRDKEFRENFKESVRQILTAGKGMAPVLMAREVAERLEGSVTQNMNVTGEITLSLAEAVQKARTRAKMIAIDADAA